MPTITQQNLTAATAILVRLLICFAALFSLSACEDKSDPKVKMRDEFVGAMNAIADELKPVNDTASAKAAKPRLQQAIANYKATMARLGAMLEKLNKEEAQELAWKVKSAATGEAAAGMGYQIARVKRIAGVTEILGEDLARIHAETN